MHTTIDIESGSKNEKCPQIERERGGGERELPTEDFFLQQFERYTGIQASEDPREVINGHSVY